MITKYGHSAATGYTIKMVIQSVWIRANSFVEPVPPLADFSKNVRD